MSTSIDYYQLREDMRAMTEAIREVRDVVLRMVGERMAAGDQETATQLATLAGEINHLLEWPHHRSHADAQAVMEWEGGKISSTVQWPSDHDTVT